MSGNSLLALSSLPVDTHPGYSVRVAMAELSTSANNLQKVLEPSFFRRLLGGTNKDYARGICAVSSERARIVRGIVQDVARAASNFSMTGGTQERDKWKSISGTCTRILEHIDEWRRMAADFEANTLGSHSALVDVNKRLMTFMRDLDHPAAGLQ